MLNAEDLMEMRKVMAASQLVLSGQFKEQIEKLEKLQAEQEKRYGALINLAAAEKAKATAEGILVAEKAKADEHAKKMAAEKEALVKAQKAAAERELQAKDKIADAGLAQRRAEQELFDIKKAQEVKDKALAVREAAISAKEAEVEELRRDLQTRVKKVKEAAAAPA